MRYAFGKLSMVCVTALVLVASGWVTTVEARPGGGGGHMGGGRVGGGGGGHMAGAHAGGGGRQINNSHVDARANHVRSNSVNSINTHRNVNVNVDSHGGCCGWDNDYHPVATAAAVTATVAVTSAVVGSMVRSVPPNCTPVNYGGMFYQQCGGTWYQAQGSQYVVVNPPY